YKDCHGALAPATATLTPAAAPTTDAADVLLRQAEEAFARGEHEVAEKVWRQALALDPDHPEALFHLGNRAHQRGEHATAVDCYERALRRAPGHAGVLNNLGLALEAAGETERAQVCYRTVLAAEPRHADALLNLANLLYRTDRYAEAARTYERAVAVRSSVPPSSWVQRALAQERLDDFAGAEASLHEAARLSPDDVRIHTNLATLYVRHRRHTEAEAPLRRALALDADNAYALSTLAYVRQQHCAWQGLSELHERIGRLLDRHGGDQQPFNPFPLLAMPTSPQQRLVAARSWARGFAAAAPARSPSVTLAAGERLRIGFVSSDFRPHATAYLLLEFWERVDRHRLEVFAYGIAKADRGPVGQRIERAFEHFADVSDESVTGIARRIRDDRICILIDLNGYTRRAREAIFALRPAPLQVQGLGYLGTLGADWYDYILTDRFVSPEQARPHFTERFLYLNDCYCPGTTQRDTAAATGDRAAHGLPATGLVFCCFNSAYKILPDVFAVWMRLLRAAPQGVLWLTETKTDTADNLRREAAAAGVDPSRLVFAPRVPLPRHLARHVHADLFLDTTPYNAGATANDALFMGIPLLTCAGETMSSRVAGSQLHAAGLPELVTTRLAAYGSLALELAREPGLLQRYRDRLAANRETWPLFDMERYAGNFADAMQRIWEDHACAAPV
ncbi:MAG: tetratricopeptide repeat protein, partial [Pseudomonadota bacterium]|nr:tetratricopeptide repeat protein [Pseudomonadota bacterium]